MTEFLRFFIRLARLQQAPQDLPASTPLLLICLLVNVLVGVAGGSRYFGSVGTALLANLLDVAVVAGMVWLLLSVNKHQVRFVQTTTALYGVGALFGLLMLLVDGLTLGGGGPVAGLLMLALLVWAHVTMGHVLRHALNQTLAGGIALAVGISAVSFVVVGNLISVPVPPAG